MLGGIYAKALSFFQYSAKKKRVCVCDKNKT